LGAKYIGVENSNMPQDSNSVAPSIDAGLGVMPVLATTPSLDGATLRYAANITDLECCPPSEAVPKDIVGYRFAFDNLQHRNNFLPVAMIDPSRKLPGSNTSIADCCTGYSLSVFASKDFLKAKIEKAIKNNPKITKKLGDHYVAINIGRHDGLCTEPNRTGHFDFFEFLRYKAIDSVAEFGPIFA